MLQTDLYFLSIFFDTLRIIFKINISVTSSTILDGFSFFTELVAIHSGINIFTQDKWSYHKEGSTVIQSTLNSLRIRSKSKIVIVVYLFSVSLTVQL